MAGMPSRSTMSTPRNCVSSPMRAPLYAASHGHQRLAASPLLRSWTASVALNTLSISSFVNALVSRVLIFLGTVTRQPVNGLREISFSPTAHANTVRAALTHTSATVPAVLSELISPLAQCCICSGNKAAAFAFGKSLCSRRNTTRHRSTVETAGLAVPIQRSNKDHGVRLESAVRSDRGNCSTHLSGP